MEMVNRVAIYVYPKEPYFAWARSLEVKSPIDDMRLGDLNMPSDDLGTVYLAESPEIPEPEKILRRHYGSIFEEQLVSWYRDTETWPARRTYKMFREWFDVRLIDLVFDLGREPPIHLV